ncbi:DUF1206 domain-containing protein [Leifsonia sp. L25]|uniref:DUF1206 domain-containing protein n=1 Tax=Leifsonia sp. L25 TaxID=3423957 RepID=UPI003D69F82E
MLILGTVGYLSKGVVVGVAGVLFVVAAVTARPDDATGLDGAMESLERLPLGAHHPVRTGRGADRVGRVQRGEGVPGAVLTRRARCACGALGVGVGVSAGDRVGRLADQRDDLRRLRDADRVRSARDLDGVPRPRGVPP